MEWYIGCSGFYYKHWKETFYPAGLSQKKWFNHYCGFFNTLELNVTFYRFPQVSFLTNWYDKSPGSFRFSVKAPRAITHYKKFNDSVALISDFYKTINQGLREKLGCVLFQLPPNMHYSEQALKKITDNLDTSFLNVVEFRHSSWWQQMVYDELANKNISFCGMSHPTLPKDIILNTSNLYYRLHGEGQLYASDYSENYLKNLHENISSQNIEQAFVYFNNDINTYAVNNALFLKSVS